MRKKYKYKILNGQLEEVPKDQVKKDLKYLADLMRAVQRARGWDVESDMILKMDKKWYEDKINEWLDSQIELNNTKKLSDKLRSILDKSS